MIFFNISSKRNLGITIKWEYKDKSLTIIYQTAEDIRALHKTELKILIFSNRFLDQKHT